MRKFSLLLLLGFIVNCGRGTEELGLIGFCGGGYPDWETSGYKLPYEAGQSFKVLQGNCASVTHNRWLTYSYDFDMPEGTQIVASRAGRVVTAGETSDPCPGTHVIVEHGDGTFARYLHLSVIQVNEGDMVAQSDDIGLSGATGCTAKIPHLHFDVSNHKTQVETLPVTFSNTARNPRGLIQGRSYAAQ